MQLADENEIRSLAFPLISSGIYGFPKDRALQVAMTTILDFLKDHEMDVYLVVFNRESFAQSRKLAGEVESYIEDNYAEEHTDRSRSESFELDDFELDDEEELVHAAPSLVEAPHLQLLPQQKECLKTRKIILSSMNRLIRSFSI